MSGVDPDRFRVIDRWLSDISATTGIDRNKLRRNIGFITLAGMLTATTEPDSKPVFLIKGGVAIDLPNIANSNVLDATRGLT